jgi:hypothetical protein
VQDLGYIPFNVVSPCYPPVEGTQSKLALFTREVSRPYCLGKSSGEVDSLNLPFSDHQGPDFDDMSSFFLYAVNVAFNY